MFEMFRACHDNLKGTKMWMYGIDLLNEMRNLDRGICGTRCGHQTSYDFIKICVLVEIFVNQVKSSYTL